MFYGASQKKLMWTERVRAMYEGIFYLGQPCFFPCLSHTTELLSSEPLLRVSSHTLTILRNADSDLATAASGGK